MFVPHSHHLADSVDDALEASTAGIRAVNSACSYSARPQHYNS